MSTAINTLRKETQSKEDPLSPLEKPSALLGADKSDGAKAHSSGEINLPSSQPMLARIGVATDALPRRPSREGDTESIDTFTLFCHDSRFLIFEF